MIKHFCDKCSKWIDDGNIYPMRITCRKIARPGVSFDLIYCKDCMEAIVPKEIRDEEAQKRAELAKRAAARKARNEGKQ